MKLEAAAAAVHEVTSNLIALGTVILHTTRYYLVVVHST